MSPPRVKSPLLLSVTTTLFDCNVPSETDLLSLFKSFTEASKATPDNEIDPETSIPEAETFTVVS